MLLLVSEKSDAGIDRGVDQLDSLCCFKRSLALSRCIWPEINLLLNDGSVRYSRDVMSRC